MDSRRRPGPMRFLVIACDCGVVVRGEIEVELLANARNHIDEAHPEMVGAVSDAELLARARVQPATA